MQDDLSLVAMTPEEKTSYATAASAMEFNSNEKKVTQILYFKTFLVVLYCYIVKVA